MRAWLYNLIRPLLIKDLDPNEDFECCHCERPVLTRVLFCSSECIEQNEFLNQPTENKESL